MCTLSRRGLQIPQRASQPAPAQPGPCPQAAASSRLSRPHRHQHLASQHEPAGTTPEPATHARATPAPLSLIGLVLSPLASSARISTSALAPAQPAPTPHATARLARLAALTPSHPVPLPSVAGTLAGGHAARSSRADRAPFCAATPYLSPGPRSGDMWGSNGA